MTMIAALSLLALATNSAPVKPVSASAKLLADYRIALEHDDADALAALFLPDAELADGIMVANGTAEIRALYVGAFAQGLSGSRLETRIDSERLLAPTVRFARGVSRITPRRRWRTNSEAVLCPIHCNDHLAQWPLANRHIQRVRAGMWLGISVIISHGWSSDDNRRACESRRRGRRNHPLL